MGFAGWIVHRAYFVIWYWSLASTLTKWWPLPWQFDSVYAFLNVTFALNHALAVGFVVGGISRWHPYGLAPTAMLLTFFLKVFHDTFDLWQNPRRPYEVAWIGVLLLLIYSLAPLLGAYMGQRMQAKFVR